MILAELQKKEQRDTKYVIKRNKMELSREEVHVPKVEITRNISLNQCWDKLYQGKILKFDHVDHPTTIPYII